VEHKGRRNTALKKLRKGENNEKKIRASSEMEQTKWHKENVKRHNIREGRTNGKNTEFIKP
jgi:hypothetical protein